MMDRREEEERKKREEKRKAELRARMLARQEQIHAHKRRSLHDKHKERRKKDCMIGLPFITAFQGDPAMPFYCNDVRDYDGTPVYELIYSERKLARLARYLNHHVVTMHAKVLIYKAGVEPLYPPNANKEGRRCPVCGIGLIYKDAYGITRCNFCGFRPDKQFNQ